MDTRSRLSRALATPALFLRGLNRLYHRRLGLRRYNTAGIDPFAADWDTLVLLDACRYDLFADRSTLPGRLERRESRASTTIEFLRANVDGRDLRDTVYVTANPQLHHHRGAIDARFAAVAEVWRDGGWDDEAGTVLPETMTDYALDAAAAYPEKRLLVHYMQPHYPFVGADVDDVADSDLDDGDVTDPDVDYGDFTDLEADGENVWVERLGGRLDIDRDEIWRRYDATLERALPAVERLLEGLDGKTVVTADHGNMVGERATPIPFREWGHPRGIYTPELVDVPWLVYRSGPRRTVRAAAALAGDLGDASDDRSRDDEVADRLRDLGYAE